MGHYEPAQLLSTGGAGGGGVEGDGHAVSSATSYAIPGTDVLYGVAAYASSCYAMSGTKTAVAMRCLVFI
eukprot:108152-Rhodomonas_salina.3